MRHFRFTFILIGLSSLILLGTGPSSLTTAFSRGENRLNSAPQWPPKAASVKCPITRDTGISSVAEETSGNNGGAERLKLKGSQEYILFDIDPAPLRGKIISGAILHVRSASPGIAPLARVGVSTVASEWVEGTSSRYRAQKGSSCFIEAEFQARPWAYPGSTIMDVVFGRGHTLWKFADCSQPDPEGWQACAVDPEVVAARVAGLSHGFLLYDEVGSTWSLRDGKFEYVYFPNRLVYSRESGASAPWLEVWVSGTDSTAPPPIPSMVVENEALPAGQALIRWKTPQDGGGAKTLGFLVSCRKEASEEAIPRYLIPMAGQGDEEVLMHLQDLPFASGETISLAIRPVDGAGNVGGVLSEQVRLSSNPASMDIPGNDIEPYSPTNTLPQVGGLRVGVLDLLDKVDPRRGEVIPRHEEGYKGGNHLFSSQKRLIRLHSARNETVGFQLNFQGKGQGISVEYSFGKNSRLKPRVFEFAYVGGVSQDGKTRFVLPDPLVPLEGAFSIPSNAGAVRIPDQTNHSLVCELYVPHDETPGKKKGKVTVSIGAESLDLDVDLNVFDFTLPDKLSFIPEMNAYRVVSPYSGYDYYRLAHEHRTCINRLPYGWDGIPEFAPSWNGDDFDWAEWDYRVGPLLDGSAFNDLPRKGEPVDVFYLPLSENWPVRLSGNYRPSYWAEEALDPEYAGKLGKAFSSFAVHCDRKRWHDTVFQFFLNNKIIYRQKFQRSSAPWIFDEPMNTQDFWALRWFGVLWRSAVDPVSGNARMWFRGDISFSQYARDLLWGVMDMEYLGDNNYQKTRMKSDEKNLGFASHFAEYGTANRLEQPNTQPAYWCISAWAKGAMGVLPWHTIGGQDSWKTGEQTALFYPDAKGPAPSIRLKAFTRGQQDVEYLELLCAVTGKSRSAVAEWLSRMIGLEGSILKSSHADAGTVAFVEEDPSSLWRLRYQVGAFLSKQSPKYRRALVEWQIPQKDRHKTHQVGYACPAPRVESVKPDCDVFR